MAEGISTSSPSSINRSSDISSSSEASFKSSASIKSLMRGDTASIKAFFALSSAISFNFLTSANASSYNCFDMSSTPLLL